MHRSLALGILLLAGCMADAEYVTSGAFTSDRTQADLDDFHATAAKYDAEVVIMESFPEQFQARGLSAAACDDLYEELKTKSYIQYASACRRAEVADDPDQATSSP